MTKFKTIEAFEEAFEDMRLDEEYAEFIMNNCHGDRLIGNGDQLILAMEDNYLLDEFQDFMVDSAAAL